MYLCIRINLNIAQGGDHTLLAYEKAFKEEVTRIFKIFVEKGTPFEYPYRNFNKSISYHCKHLVLICAKEMYEAYKRKETYRFDFSSYWSNSSYEIKDQYLLVELGPDQYRDRLMLPIYPNRHPLRRLEQGTLMNMKLIHRKGKWVAKIWVNFEPQESTNEEIMGIDIGVKVPAVAVLSNGKVRFFGNGREIRFRQRNLRSHIIAMQRSKQYHKLVKFEHKLSHVLNDYDHKISKEIIDYAIKYHVGLIKLENLTAINQKFKVHHNPNIYLWSYRRLQEYITYKAKLHGIKVQYINPYQTSQLCPKCGQINHAKDRTYRCSCGYQNHRDIVAAINILNAL